jgi:hypothetical protein
MTKGGPGGWGANIIGAWLKDPSALVNLTIETDRRLQTKPGQDGFIVADAPQH